MNTRIVALAVAATLGLGSVSAFAQDYHRHDRNQWQSQRADQGRSWGSTAYNHRYAAPRYYGPRYAPSYGYYRDDSGDAVGALVLGALAGAMIGQASNSYVAPPPATYYAPPPAYYNPGYGYYYPN